MMHTFDKEYWEQHWEAADPGRRLLANPYLAREVGDLVPGTAIDAGCGDGVEAIWLAAAGWRVTAADISAAALARATQRAAGGDKARTIDWVEADLSVWEPGHAFDLVMTHYAHPAMPQLAFYERIARWVAPSGTLLIVGHRFQHDHGGADDDASDTGRRPPAHASVTAASVVGLLDPAVWDVVTADEVSRSVGGSDLFDVVVRAVRRADAGTTR
jgi:SAM-dependent methyltransferase